MGTVIGRSPAEASGLQSRGGRYGGGTLVCEWDRRDLHDRLGGGCGGAAAGERGISQSEVAVDLYRLVTVLAEGGGARLGCAAAEIFGVVHVGSCGFFVHRGES